jgi:hypothetical protein
LIGFGPSGPGLEQSRYVLPLVAVNPTSIHRFSFRLGSYQIGSTSSTSGVDVDDYVEVRLSINGSPYISELRITGNGNVTWDYTSTGTITHTANGTFTNLPAPIGDVYRAPAGPGLSTTAPSTIILNLPVGITQVAVDLYCRVNSAGEQWWIDNVLLEEIYDCTIFPLELLYFNTEYRKSNKDVYLFWNVVLDEYIDGFVIEKSLDGIEFDSIGFVNVTNSDQSFFDFNDKTPTSNGFTYYRLKWVEGGHTSYSNISAVEIKNDNNFSFTPSNNELVIQKHIIDNSIYSIKIIDNIGKQIFSKNNIKSNLEKIDITDLPSGVYVISIETEQEIKTHRFIKK